MELRKKLAQEPVTFLYRKMWRFSKGYRHRVVLFLSMSAFANLIVLTQPLILGLFLNELQKNGVSGEVGRKVSL